MFGVRPSMRAVAVAVLASAAAMSSGCADEAGGAEAKSAVPGSAGVAVVTAPVVARDMPVNVRVVGNVEPSSTVEVRSQVTGTLQQVAFTEGQDVAQGQLLFTIDPRPAIAAPLVSGALPGVVHH